MPALKRILVACGAALATSTVVSRKLEEELAARGIRVVTEQAKVSEVAAAATNYDLIVTTGSVSDVGDTPVIQTVSFLTGIGIERDVDEIVAKLSEQR
jgi:PTS system galactitol-specific IIB component